MHFHIRFDFFRGPRSSDSHGAVLRRLIEKKSPRCSVYLMLMCNTYICSFSVSVTYKRKTGHKGKKGTPPLSEGVPYEIP